MPSKSAVTISIIRLDDMLVSLVWKIPKQPTISGFYKKNQKLIEALGPFFYDSLLFHFGPQRHRIQLLTIVSSAQSSSATHRSSCVFVCFAFVSSILLLELPPFPCPFPHRQTFLYCQCVSVCSHENIYCSI